MQMPTSGLLELTFMFVFIQLCKCSKSRRFCNHRVNIYRDYPKWTDFFFKKWISYRVSKIIISIQCFRKKRKKELPLSALLSD